MSNQTSALPTTQWEQDLLISNDDQRIHHREKAVQCGIHLKNMLTLHTQLQTQMALQPIQHLWKDVTESLSCLLGCHRGYISVLKQEITNKRKNCL